MDAPPTGDQTLRDWCAALAAKQPTPGGGAVAAVVGAIASSLGAMAANYTTGKRYADQADAARDLAHNLNTAGDCLLELADEDAAAFTDLQTVQRAEPKDPAAIAEATARCAAVPAAIMATCASHATALQAFAAQCNPYLISDLNAALHLLRGAAGAAYEILLINEPSAAQQTAASEHLAAVDAACS